MAGPAFDLGFAFQGLRSSLIGFFIQQLNRSARSGVNAAFFAAVFIYSSTNVGSCASIKSVIRTS